MNEQPIATIPKNTNERIQVDFTEYKGHDLLDVRVYYTDGVGDAWKPTRKGLALRRDAATIRALRDALDKALVELPLGDADGVAGDGDE
jgi:hypothetical protein